MNSGRLADGSSTRLSNDHRMASDEGFFAPQEPQRPISAVMEKILIRKSLQLRELQHAWQVSFDFEDTCARIVIFPTQFHHLSFFI